MQINNVDQIQQVQMLEHHPLNLFSGTEVILQVWTKKYWRLLYKIRSTVGRLLAVAHVYTLADIAALILRQLQFSRLSMFMFAKCGSCYNS